MISKRTSRTNLIAIIAVAVVTLIILTLGGINVSQNSSLTGVSSSHLMTAGATGEQTEKGQKIDSTSASIPKKNKFCRTQFSSKEDAFEKIIYEKKKTKDDDTADKSLLIMVSFFNKKSYGRGRTFEDVFSTISSFYHDVDTVSMGFLIGDEQEFQSVDAYFQNFFDNTDHSDGVSSKIVRVTLLTAPFIESVYNSDALADRHDDKVQRNRRKKLGRTRNFLIYNVLRDETYTIFMDADVFKVESKNMVSEFISSGKDIIVPRIIRGSNIDYDKNSWVGQRTVPNEKQFKALDNHDFDNFDYVPRDVPDRMMHFDKFINQNIEKPASDPLKQENYLMKLDSVGGAILFVKSIIYKQGISFPPYYIIGTTWDRLEGYDGVESEGLCYGAISIGYECWGMPNMIAYHVDE